MTNHSQSADSFASQLASRLRGPDAQAAWDDFLSRYAETILLIAKRHNHNRDDCNDCFVFVCEKLSERGYERLLKFQPGGRASFRSWLNVVVANLCIDWHRARHGRIRPFSMCTVPISPGPGRIQVSVRPASQPGRLSRVAASTLSGDRLTGTGLFGATPQQCAFATASLAIDHSASTVPVLRSTKRALISCVESRRTFPGTRRTCGTK